MLHMTVVGMEETLVPTNPLGYVYGTEAPNDGVAACASVTSQRW